MFKKLSTYLHWEDEAFKTALAAMQHLRKLFLSMPFEDFVNIDKLWKSLPSDNEIHTYLMRLDARLDFGTDSFRYYMQYLGDAKTAEVADKYSWHSVHTDFRGRCEINHTDKAIGFAMGFYCIDEDLDIVAKLGYEVDPGAVEETISTKLGEVIISGYKNTKGNYHGFCQIEYEDGTNQECFFNDGKILARKIYYTNGAREDLSDSENIAVDPFANRSVYEVVDDGEDNFDCDPINIDRDKAVEIFNILGEYSLEMKSYHTRQYPYDDNEYEETESAQCVPCLNMALLYDGELWGVVLQTNKYGILPIGSEEYSLKGNWKTYAVALDEVFTEGNLKISLKKKSK